MLLGYMRVSKSDGSQVLDLQRDALLAAGVDPAQLYEDYASGKKDDRPGLLAALKAARSGDVLTVWKTDRLGRSLRHLVNTVHDLEQRGIGFKVLTGQGAAIEYHNSLRQADLRDLRGLGRVGKGSNRRKDHGGAGLRSCKRPERWPPLHDDPRQGSVGDGGDGKA